MNMNFEQSHERFVMLINTALADSLPSAGEQSRLYESMKYSLLAGGKRVRPALLLMFAGDTNPAGLSNGALPFALAVEMLHTYSLIHDDLPGMDNDSLRRGRPTNHIAFGESTAIVAGDALQAYAFETMLSAILTLNEPTAGVEAARLIAEAAGAKGMCGGQVLDMENDSRQVDVERLRRTSLLKTGALLTAACEAGAVLSGTDTAGRTAARAYGQNIGLAFQIVDDLLDSAADERLFGKPVGSDEAQGKHTFRELAGEQSCRVMIERLTGQAKAAAEGFPNAELLKWYADELASRVY